MYGSERCFPRLAPPPHSERNTTALAAGNSTTIRPSLAISGSCGCGSQVPVPSIATPPKVYPLVAASPAPRNHSGSKRAAVLPVASSTRTVRVASLVISTALIPLSSRATPQMLMLIAALTLLDHAARQIEGDRALQRRFRG
jgi:hypothetical protein